jgi:hypothetical protein
MSLRRTALALAFAAGALPLALGANVLRITPAPSLAGVSPLPVKGRSPTAFDKQVQFGAWRVKAASKFDMHEQSVAAAAESTRARKELGLRENLGVFELDVAREGGDATRVRCETRTFAGSRTRSAGRLSDETSLTLPGYPRIDCTFSGAQAGLVALQAAPITLYETGHADMSGARWQLRSVGKVARLGYELRLGSDVVATVETASAGRVWISPTLDAARQEELAVLTGALLYSTAALELQDP